MIILFDGVCNLCNGFVNFLIDRDSENVFRFASLQSDFGQKILNENKLTIIDYQSVIVIKDNELFQKSAAVFEIARFVKGWAWIRIFRFLPINFTNFFYDVIAKNRYKIFGKSENCRVPTLALKAKFLD